MTLTRLPETRSAPHDGAPQISGSRDRVRWAARFLACPRWQTGQLRTQHRTVLTASGKGADSTRSDASPNGTAAHLIWWRPPTTEAPPQGRANATFRSWHEGPADFQSALLSPASHNRSCAQWILHRGASRGGPPRGCTAHKMALCPVGLVRAVMDDANVGITHANPSRHPSCHDQNCAGLFRWAGSPKSCSFLMSAAKLNTSECFWRTGGSPLCKLAGRH